MPDRDHDISSDYLTYGRPSTASWVAAAAVAIAVFVLGGFIKTSRQMEALVNERNELRREKAELERELNALRHAPPPATSRQPPPARTRRSQDQNPGRQASRAEDNRAGVRSGIPEIDEPAKRVTYSIGRTTKSSGLAGAEAELSASGADGAIRSSVRRQIIIAGKKVLMIEGGLDIGFREDMRLELRRDGKWIGELRVVEAYATMSACEILHAAHPPEPGDVVLRPVG